MSLALGIGAIIGAGIFVLTGRPQRPHAGPARALSFVIAAIACLFAGLSYAELAAMIPVAGSAYTYTYATIGEFMAWIIGWDLILDTPQRVDGRGRLGRLYPGFPATNSASSCLPACRPPRPFGRRGPSWHDHRRRPVQSSRP